MAFEIPERFMNPIKKTNKWMNLLPANPIKQLISCDEPFTIYNTLIDLVEIPQSDPLVSKVRKEMINHPLVLKLIDAIPPWEEKECKGHQQPHYAPNILKVLFDFGLTPKDNPIIKKTLKGMLKSQDSQGYFQSLGGSPPKKGFENRLVWGSVPCDHHIITETLIRGGLLQNNKVKKGINLITQNLEETTQGLAWKCRPHTISKARGPGRKDESCPIVTLEALRLFSQLPPSNQPPKDQIKKAGNTLLQCWINRKTHKPYMFGHGKRFQNGKPPYIWYDIVTLTDTLSRYPELSKQKPYKEMIKSMISQTNPNGTFTTKSIYRTFPDFSFGQKKQWSPWVTYYICSIIKRS